MNHRDAVCLPRMPSRISWVLVRAGAVTFACLLNAAVAIAADTTAPTTPVVLDQGTYTSVATQLTASWSSRDPESGIMEYQYLIRQDSTSGPIVANWTSARTATSVTRRLRLQHGKTYYLGVKARNRVGLWSAIGYSDGLTVDRTAPVVATVIDDGETTTSTDRLHASWSGDDPESGILAYEYEIRQDSPHGRLIVAWKPVGTALEATVTHLRLKSGGRYYIGVRAKNRAGLLSKPRYSDGITVQPLDTTPPRVVIVYPQDGALLGAR